MQAAERLLVLNVLEETACVNRSFWLAIHEDVHQYARTRYFVDFLVR